MLKRVGESTSLTEPWTTRVQKRLKVILRKAKELSRVRSDCISNSVLQFKPCQEKDSLKQRKDYLPVGSNRIQRIHNLTFGDVQDTIKNYPTYEEPQGFPDSFVGKESTCNAGDPGSIPGSGRSPGEGKRLPTPVILGFPCGSAGKESTRNAGDLASIPGLGRSPGEGKGCPLQYSGLENFMDCIVHGVAKSRTQLSDFHFHEEPTK